MKRIMWSAIGIAIGILPVAASSALANEIVALTVNPTGTILPGRTAAQISGTVICDITTSGPGGIEEEFLTLNQTGRHTQFIAASDPAAPDPVLICDGSLQTWSRTVLVNFPMSGRLHKGRAGVTVQFDDGGTEPIIDNDSTTAFGSVFIK